MTNKDYGIERKDYIGDINTHKLCTHCVVCGNLFTINDMYEKSTICQECKEAIKWAKEKMKNDK